MELGIIGLGHVGKITQNILSSFCEVKTYDHKFDYVLPNDYFCSCDYVIICVDTPPNQDGSADISNVRAALSRIPKSKPVILRSTVPPGSCASLSKEFSIPICFWPEYIGETCFIIDTWDYFRHKNPFVILGIMNDDKSFVNWVDFLTHVYGPLCRFSIIDSDAAELVKYMENAYFAVKTTFVNEMREICNALELSWIDVREGWLLDSRIDRDHSDAFAFAPGYYGKCLPKDLSALIKVAEKLDVNSILLKAVQQSNRIRQDISDV
jgi:nucleotide sugar dehydrogenase